MDTAQEWFFWMLPSCLRPKTLREQIRQHEREIRKDLRQLDLDISRYQQDETRARNEVRRLVNANKASEAKNAAVNVARLSNTISQCNKIKMNMNQVMTMLKTNTYQHSMQKTILATTRMMKSINETMPIQSIMRLQAIFEMEMNKMEDRNDAFTEMIESSPGEDNEEIQVTADQVLSEIMDDVVSRKLPDAPVGQPVVLLEEHQPEDDDIMKRFNSLNDKK